MKKLFMLATAAFLFTGAFAQDGKKCSGNCCKKGHSAKKAAVAKKDVKTVTTVKKA